MSGGNFTGHATLTQKPGNFVRGTDNVFINSGNDLYQFGIFVCSWVSVKQAVNIGEVDQKPGIRQVGDHAAEIVVITEFNFIHNNRIVFIDNRDDFPG